MSLASGSAATLTFSTPTITVTGLSGVASVWVGDTILITGAATAANNGYFTIASVVSASSVTYTNASGATDAHNGSIVWAINEIRIDSGSAATFSSFSNPNVTVTGLANLVGGTTAGGYVGNTITISNANTGASNGTFPITSIVSASSLIYTNASGSATDTHNGSIWWTINHLDRGISSFTDPRQSDISEAGLLEQPTSSRGLYSGIPDASYANNSLDKDKGLAILVGQASNGTLANLKPVYYYLTAICSTGNVRQYWVDTVIALTNAPACMGGYVANSLTVLGTY